jgi:uncharacterized membrane protein HdeD (DUF308 family)
MTVTTADALRLIGLLVLLVDIGLIIWLMFRARWYKPVGWIMLVWGILNAIFNAVLLFDNWAGDIISDDAINKLSQSLRLETYLSVLVILVIVAAEARKAKK